MNEENTSQKTHKKNWKYILLLFIGVLIIITAIYIETGNLYKYDIPVVIGYILCYLLLWFFGLGLIALIASRIMGDVKKYWLTVFTWLFLIVVLFDTATELSNKLSYNYKKFAFNRDIKKLLKLRKQIKSQKGILTHIGGPMVSGPKPPDGAILKDTSTTLFWPNANFAVSYDVYFGDNFDDVNAGAQSTFVGNQTQTFTVVGLRGCPFPNGLVPGTTYYWRIDEVNQAEPDSPWKGYVWSFSIPRMYDYFPYRDDTESKDEAKKADNSSP